MAGNRRAFDSSTTVSLLAFAAAVALWAWSYDTWRAGAARCQLVLVFYRGAILLIPFSCLAIMAAYFVLNRLTGFSITD